MIAEKRSVARRLALAAFFSVALVWPSLISAQNQREQEPVVSWVNPQLPDGPGLTHHVLASKALGHDVGYVVWTPGDYDAKGDRRYPVVYFLHGLGGNESSDSAGFSGLVARAIREGTMPPVICVFPNGGRSGYRGEVETMIVEELIPLIDKSLPTKADAKSRLAAGFSMGGAGAVRLSLAHPELFCAAASWGGRTGRGSDSLLASVEQNAKTLQANNFAMLLVNGDQDRPDSFRPLSEKLKQAGIENELVVLQDTPHNLGLYYQRSGDKMVEFLGSRLKR